MNFIMIDSNMQYYACSIENMTKLFIISFLSAVYFKLQKANNVRFFCVCFYFLGRVWEVFSYSKLFTAASLLIAAWH